MFWGFSLYCGVRWTEQGSLHIRTLAFLVAFSNNTKVNPQLTYNWDNHSENSKWLTIVEWFWLLWVQCSPSCACWWLTISCACLYMKRRSLLLRCREQSEKNASEVISGGAFYNQMPVCLTANYTLESTSQLSCGNDLSTHYFPTLPWWWET